MISNTLIFLSLLQSTLSLSSQSPPDPLAYPKYSVSLSGWSEAINNATASAILNNLGPDSQDAISLLGFNSGSPLLKNNENVRHTLMRTASGQAFICSLPPLPSAASSKNSTLSKDALVAPTTSLAEDSERKQERQRIEEEGLKNGLKLISSLKDRCIYTRLGWFTYSFCYGKGEIRQFHALIVPGFNHPQEDPTQDVYVLGFHLDHPQNPHHQARLEGTLPAPTVAAGEGELTSLGRNRFSSGGGSMLGSISDVLRDESVIRSSVEKEEEEFEQKRYLVQRWDGGTICDMTGKPRSVEVQFHCSTLASDHIALLRETSICEYLLVIHTPRLCSEPLFLDGGSKKGIGAGEIVTDIACSPVLTDEEIEKWKANEQARATKQEEEKIRKLQSLEDSKTKTEIKLKQHTGPDSSDPGSPKIEEVGNSDDSSPERDSGSSTDRQELRDDNEESAPRDPSDQQVFQTTGETNTKAESKKSQSVGGGDNPTAKDQRPSVIEVDPITVYFDTDTGKVYVDNPADGRGPVASETTGRSPKAAQKNSDTKSEPRSEGKPKTADQTKENDSPPVEVEEIAKALKESLGALLRDLRAEDDGNEGRRLNNAHRNRPKSLSEILAALKESDSSASKKSRPLENKSQKNNEGQLPPQSWDDIKKLSSESHSKLVEMYQQKFDLFDPSSRSGSDEEEHEQKEKK